jgi:hypothetical protein
MFEWLKSKFKKKEAVKPKYENFNSPYIKPVGPPNVNSRNTEKNNDGDFATSMVVSMATDSVVAGYVAGGSLSGAVVGEMLNNSSESSGSNFNSYDPGPSFSSCDSCGCGGCD